MPCSLVAMTMCSTSGGLRVTGTRAVASVQAKRVYRVELSWDPELGGRCSCPHHDGGQFCKHLVAVGLAVLTEQGVRAAGHVSEKRSALHAFLDGLDRAALTSLVMDLVDAEPAVGKLVQARAAAAGIAGVLDSAELVEAVSLTLRVGFVDYRRSFDVARDVHVVLDDLERLLDAGAADAVRPALDRAMSRLRSVTGSADDSAGVLGDAYQRAAELHAHAYSAGVPDPAGLARWLLKFRSTSPGWPQLSLKMYIRAFDDAALNVYRTGVARLERSPSGSEQADRFDRFEIERMMLELADHDQDLDRAITLLSARPDRTQYGQIIDRLHAADRPEEAVRWLDAAIDAGRIADHPSGGNDFWITPRRAAEIYLASDREQDALAVLRSHFASRPGPDSLALLLEVARPLGYEDAERAWALTTAERRAAEPYEDGHALIEIALAGNDLPAAWEAYEKFGAGPSWRHLAQASRTTRPAAAAELYRPHVEDLLPDAITSNYPKIAELLTEMRDLYTQAGDHTTAAEYAEQIRERYPRRTSLHAAINHIRA